MSDDQTVSEPTETEPADTVAPVSPSEDATRNLDVILDLDLPLTVRFGQAQISLGSLVQMGPGSVLNLDRSPNDPVEVLVNGKVIARGEVVAVAGHYGVRITNIVSPLDRIPELGG